MLEAVRFAFALPSLQVPIRAEARSTGSAATTGDLEALYREHRLFVWRTVQRFGVPAALADDAVHETYLVVSRRLGEFEGRSSVRTWIFAIAMRVAQSFRRDEARSRAKALALHQHDPTHRLAPDLVQRQESAALLHRLLDLLDEQQRAAFVLIELEGMTAAEVAEATGAKLATVYSRLRLAREKLEKAAAAWDKAEPATVANGLAGEPTS